MNGKSPLWTFKEDWAESLIMVASVMVIDRASGHQDIQGACVIVNLLCLARLVTEMFARSELNRATRYVTAHGLRVIGIQVPDPRYVEKMCSETLEWFVDHDLVDSKKLARISRDGPWLTGVVLEIPDGALPECCELVCPWPLLPWDGSSWIRCGMNTDKTLPALPHVLFHVLAAKIFGITQIEAVHVMVDEHSFDVSG